MSSATVDTVIEMQNMKGENENSSVDEPNPQLRVKGASNQNLFNRLSQQCGGDLNPCGFTFKGISELEKYVNDDSKSAEVSISDPNFIQRGSPTFAVFTTVDPTTEIFGLCTHKWEIH